MTCVPFTAGTMGHNELISDLSPTDGLPIPSNERTITQRPSVHPPMTLTTYIVLSWQGWHNRNTPIMRISHGGVFMVTGYLYGESTWPGTSPHNGAHHLAAIVGATILVPCHVIKSLQLIWRSGTRRFNLRVPDLQMSCSDLTWR